MTPSELLTFLQKIPLFSGVNADLLQNTLQSEHAHRAKLAAGDILPPHFGEMLGVVLCGKLRILSADQSRSVVLRSIAKADIFGAASLFGDRRVPLSRLKATSACELLFLDHDAVNSLLRADADFMDAYLRLLANRIDFLNAKIRAFTAGSAERRLALWLADHAVSGTVCDVNFMMLADILDIGRASLYRALDKLESESLITRSGRDISIPHAEYLLQKYNS